MNQFQSVLRQARAPKRPALVLPPVIALAAAAPVPAPAVWVDPGLKLRRKPLRHATAPERSLAHV